MHSYSAYKRLDDKWNLFNVGGGEQMINWSFLAHAVFGMEVHFVPIHIASSRNGFKFQPHTRPTYLCCLNMPSLKDLRWYHFCNSSWLERPGFERPGLERPHSAYSWYIKWQKCARMGLDGFHIKWMIGIHCNWKNQNPGSCFGATS